MLSTPFLIANKITHLQGTCLQCARDQHSANSDYAATDTASLHFGDPIMAKILDIDPCFPFSARLCLNFDTVPFNAQEGHQLTVK